MVSVNPHKWLGPIFHIATILIVLLIAVQPARMGRVLAAYMGLNYLVIAFVQTMATTAKYGFVLQTGGFIADSILGAVWIVVAIRGGLDTSFKNVVWHRYLLLPLAVLAFWSPWTLSGAAIIPNFDPLLLLTSPDYGLTYCLTTPVFLFLLILFYPNINSFAYRITAFNGLIYGLFNLTHWFNSDTRWMGFLHLPLLLISLYALILPRVPRSVRAARLTWDAKQP
jgi:drug/metabolite transporter superfamily protein YnfA